MLWRHGSSCGEFCKVVGGADHCPFALDLVDATEEELSVAFGLLDVSKDGFDGALVHVWTSGNRGWRPKRS